MFLKGFKILFYSHIKALTHFYFSIHAQDQHSDQNDIIDSVSEEKTLTRVYFCNFDLDDKCGGSLFTNNSLGGFIIGGYYNTIQSYPVTGSGISVTVTDYSSISI